VKRRLSDFFALCTARRNRYPRCVIPILPDKAILQGELLSDKTLLEKRTQDLEVFAKEVLPARSTSTLVGMDQTVLVIWHSGVVLEFSLDMSRATSDHGAFMKDVKGCTAEYRAHSHGELQSAPGCTWFCSQFRLDTVPQFFSAQTFILYAVHATAGRHLERDALCYVWFRLG
jgi:hypothetical protein